MWKINDNRPPERIERSTSAGMGASHLQARPSEVSGLTVTVLIPTYRRHEDLARCLEALKNQTRLPIEVLVVVHESDAETWALLENLDPGPLTLRVLTTSETSLAASLSVGQDAARGDIVAQTDDDAAPHPDWVARIEAHFRADPNLGGLGGRDWLHHSGRVEDGSREVVGKIQWFGREIGNHHLGVGGPREVDILKGVNMSFRSAAIRGIRPDERLRGVGAQPDDEWAFCLGIQRAGWKLIYDPAVAVDHYTSPRRVGDQRIAVDAEDVTNQVHNRTLALLDHFSPLRRVALILWALLVGTRLEYGLVQWLRFLPREGRVAGVKLRASLEGRLEGWRTWRRSRSTYG